MREKNNKGFTLVEVLAVVVIIGILMVIAMPSYTAVYNGLSRTTYLNKIKTANIAAEDFANNAYIKDTIKAQSMSESKPFWCKQYTVSSLIKGGYLQSDSDYKDIIIDNISGKPIGRDMYSIYTPGEDSTVSVCYCYNTMDIKSFVVKDLYVPVRNGKVSANYVFYEGEYVRYTDNDGYLVFAEITKSFNFSNVINVLYPAYKNKSQEQLNNLSPKAEGEDISLSGLATDLTIEQFIEAVGIRVINAFGKPSTCTRR